MSRHHPLVRHHLETGLREHARGNASAARDAYQQALALAPDNPDALGLLGAALLQLGQAQQALEPLRRAASALRHRPEVLGNLAQAHFALGRFAEACDGFRRASRLDPRQSRFRLGLANSLAMQGKLAEAEKLLRRLADAQPNDALAWFNLGNVVRDQGRLSDAAHYYRQALEIEPGWINARSSLGSVLHVQYLFEEAEREYRMSLATNPDHVPTLYNLASVLIDDGRFAEAEAVCRDIAWRDPAAPLAQSFLGVALGAQGKLAAALECHGMAAQLAPGDPVLARTFAATLAASGALEPALEAFARALDLDPGSAATRYSRSIALLAHGRWADGWADYAYRPAFAGFSERQREIRLHRTLPAIDTGMALWLVAEQGLGDELFFLRFVPRLSAAGIRVSYRASRKIHSLIARLDWLHQVVDESAPLPRGDETTVMMMGDLPHALGVGSVELQRAGETGTHQSPGNGIPHSAPLDAADVPPPVKLQPLEVQLARMRARLDELGNPPYLGVTWRGGTAPREQRGADWMLHKEASIASLAEGLRDFPGTVLVLQRNPALGEIERLSAALARPAQDFSALNNDLEEMLALLALIDEYVAVSNTNLHLRAGTGRTARVLVPLPSEWRWTVAGDRSPWFAGFSIYRQSDQGDWNAAMCALRQDLAGTDQRPSG